MGETEYPGVRPGSFAADLLLGKPHKVLDQGHVRLIDYMGNDAAIVQAARVSYGDGTKTPSDDEALIRYLLRNRHTSPIEMCEIKLHCKMPIFVARQWVRHRTANINEVSGRYSVLPDQWYTPDASSVLVQSLANKQGRGSEDLPDHVIGAFLAWCAENEDTFGDYKSACANGLARELARINLPLSTYTEWYWKIDLHNLLHFLALRADEHAQWEIRQYAETILKIVQAWVPATHQAFLDYRLNAVTFSALEMEVLKSLLDYRTIEGMDEGHPLFTLSPNMTKRERNEFIAKLCDGGGR